MTEDDAKTKWCFHCIASHTNPRAREWVQGDVGDNSGPFYHHCIGSRCMAWRWETDFNDLNERHPTLSLDELRAVGHGYCGMAGKP